MLFLVGSTLQITIYGAVTCYSSARNREQVSVSCKGGLGLLWHCLFTVQEVALAGIKWLRRKDGRKFALGWGIFVPALCNVSSRKQKAEFHSFRSCFRDQALNTHKVDHCIRAIINRGNDELVPKCGSVSSIIEETDTNAFSIVDSLTDFSHSGGVGSRSLEKPAIATQHSIHRIASKVQERLAGVNDWIASLLGIRQYKGMVGLQKCQNCRMLRKLFVNLVDQFLCHHHVDTVITILRHCCDC
jgi:hypothetical protein